MSLINLNLPRRPFLRLVRSLEQLAADYHALNRAQLERLAEIERQRGASRRLQHRLKDFVQQDDHKVYERDRRNRERVEAGLEPVGEVTR